MLVVCSGWYVCNRRINMQQAVQRSKRHTYMLYTHDMTDTPHKADVALYVECMKTDYYCDNYTHQLTVW